MVNSSRTSPSFDETSLGKKNAVSSRFLRAETLLKSGFGTPPPSLFMSAGNSRSAFALLAILPLSVTTESAIDASIAIGAIGAALPFFAIPPPPKLL